jgi:hypothetical protein
MQTVRQDQNLEFFFPVVSAGALVTGLLNAAFTVTLVAPSGAVTVLGPVTETAKLGVYTVAIGFASWTVPGMYAITIEVGAPGPTDVISDEIYVLQPEGEAQASVTFDAAANTIRVNAWLMEDVGQKTTNLFSATLRLFDRTGVALTALLTQTTPDANGVFEFDVPAPAFVIGETETYFVLVLTTNNPTVVHQAIIGVTFSRTN